MGAVVTRDAACRVARPVAGHERGRQAGQGRSGERVGPVGRCFEPQQRCPGAAPHADRRTADPELPGRRIGRDGLDQAGLVDVRAPRLERPCLRIEGDERCRVLRPGIRRHEELAADDEPAVVQRECADGRRRIGEQRRFEAGIRAQARGQRDHPGRARSADELEVAGHGHPGRRHREHGRGVLGRRIRVPVHDVAARQRDGHPRAEQVVVARSVLVLDRRGRERLRVQEANPRNRRAAHETARHREVAQLRVPADPVARVSLEVEQLAAGDLVGEAVVGRPAGVAADELLLAEPVPALDDRAGRRVHRQQVAAVVVAPARVEREGPAHEHASIEHDHPGDEAALDGAATRFRLEDLRPRPAAAGEVVARQVPGRLDVVRQRADPRDVGDVQGVGGGVPVEPVHRCVAVVLAGARIEVGQRLVDVRQRRGALPGIAVDERQASGLP